MLLIDGDTTTHLQIANNYVELGCNLNDIGVEAFSLQMLPYSIAQLFELPRFAQRNVVHELLMSAWPLRPGRDVHLAPRALAGRKCLAPQSCRVGDQDRSDAASAAASRLDLADRRALHKHSGRVAENRNDTPRHARCLYPSRYRALY